MEPNALGKKVNALLDAERWADAQKLLARALRREPDSHWLLTRLSSAYYEDRQYERAVELAARALKLAPWCPLVLWDLAGALQMAGRPRDAIRIWKKLIARGPTGLAADNCGEGIARARSMVTDARYRVGTAYWDLNQYAAALRHMDAHLAERALRRTQSLYPVVEVRERRARVLEEQASRAGQKQNGAVSP